MSAPQIEGWYGAAAAHGGFYWFAGPVHTSTEIVDGFADSREQALQTAEDAARARWPAIVPAPVKVARYFFQQRHAKVGRFRGDWRQRFPFWAERTHLFETYDNGYDDSVLRWPIVAVTDRWVYVPRERRFAAAVSPERVARRDCRALPRLKLEQDGWASNDGRYLEVKEPDVMREADVAAATAAEVAALRARVQKAHPDMGGDAAEFRKAKAELDRARGRA